MIETNGEMDPIALHSILETTAVPFVLPRLLLYACSPLKPNEPLRFLSRISSTTNGSALDTVAQHDAGLVDTYAAVYAKTVVSPGEVPLNDTLHAATKFNVTISNQGKKHATYRLSNVPAQTALTFSDEGRQPNLLVPLVDGAAELYFSNDHVLVKKGKSVQVEDNVVGSNGLDPWNVPVYSGFVQVEAVNGTEVMKNPYLGTAASMYHDFPIMGTARSSSCSFSSAS
jgi:hypothetical protein